MALSKKQRAFIEHYLKCWNAAEAARLAGYSEKTARQQGSRLLTKVDIEAAIQARVDELSMSANEALIRLTEQARADYAQYFRHAEIANKDGNREWVVFFDFAACQADDKMHLIKSIKHDRNENLEIEFYDAQTALVHIGRHHKLFTDKTDLTSGGEKLETDDSIRQDILSQLSRIAAASETSGISEQSND